jgi:hypothetical protein
MSNCNRFETVGYCDSEEESCVVLGYVILLCGVYQRSLIANLVTTYRAMRCRFICGLFNVVVTQALQRLLTE